MVTLICGRVTIWAPNSHLKCRILTFTLAMLYDNRGYDRYVEVCCHKSSGFLWPILRSSSPWTWDWDFLFTSTFAHFDNKPSRPSRSPTRASLNAGTPSRGRLYQGMALDSKYVWGECPTPTNVCMLWVHTQMLWSFNEEDLWPLNKGEPLPTPFQFEVSPTDSDDPAPPSQPK